MKICNVCKKEKALSEFSKNARKKDGYQYTCRECTSEYAKGHYKKNKKAYAISSDAARLRSVEKKRDYIYRYYMENPCVDCGNDDVRVLQSDHIYPAEKSYEIAKLVNSGYSLESLISELSKCVTRCANCHQIRTAEQLGLWRHNYVV